MAKKAGEGDNVVPIGAKASKASRKLEPGVGHNGPSQDDVRHYVRKQIEFNNRRALLNAEISSFRRAAKLAGMELGVMDLMVKMLEWEIGEIKDAFRTRDFYAESLGFPVGTQLELFGADATPDHTREELRWRGKGRIDGIAGRGDATEPPDHCPPEFTQAYGEGWEAGQKETQESFLRRNAAKRPVEDF